MTVSVGWLDVGNVFQYHFSPDWTWQEFETARRVAATVLKNTQTDPEKLIDVIVEYSDVGNWFPPNKPKQHEPPMGEIEEALPKIPSRDSNRKKKRQAHKRSQKQAYGHDVNIPKGDDRSPNVPEELLEELEHIAGVDTLYVIGINPRALRVFTTMLQPAYEWDFVEEIEDAETMVELIRRDSDGLPFQTGHLYTIATETRQPMHLKH